MSVVRQKGRHMEEPSTHREEVGGRRPWPHNTIHIVTPGASRGGMVEGEEVSKGGRAAPSPQPGLRAHSQGPTERGRRTTREGEKLTASRSPPC